MDKNYHYLPKEEFKRRLLFLRKNLDVVLNSPLTYPSCELLPALFSVYSYMWGKRQEDLFKKVYSLSREDSNKLFENMDLSPVPDGAKLFPSVCEIVSVGDDYDDIPF